MSNTDCITALAQALSDNPHKNVLMKNALQAAQPSDHSVLNLGSPKDIADSTHSTSSKSSRSSDLQPVNDPFLLDNIFKSPKKRRRGLLSWSAVPSDYTLHGSRTISMSRELSRHSRVKQRRQSILGTKSRQPSLRRRQTNRSSSNEHARSASDPTGATGGSPKSVASTLPQSSSPTPVPSEASSPEPRRCKKAQSLAFFPAHKKTLSSGNSSMASEMPPLPDSCSSAASTLRGVPHATPYISVSALRLVSDSGRQSGRESVVTIRHPDRAKVKQRPDSGRLSAIDRGELVSCRLSPASCTKKCGLPGSPFLPVARSSRAGSRCSSRTASERERKERADGWLSAWFSSLAVPVLKRVASCGVKAKH
ncbi:hypothetical protein EC988_002756 [Linderina pennispora]|nr:hypothetical protein EC988_002756 [Linderina pennispora]